MMVMLISSVLMELCLQAVEAHVPGMAVTIALLRLASTCVLVLSLARILKLAWRELVGP